MIKNNVVVYKNKGKFIKPCPGTPGHICCGYMIIDFAHGCNLGCTYCILNYYFKNKPLELYSNIEDLLLEVETYLNKRKKLIRFGTGEFTDSLLFDDVHPIYDKLIPLISNRNDAILELKTKTTNIQRLLKIKERNNIIISWSLNSDYIAKNEEIYAPSISERIDAAYKVQEAGYRLSFHFDPIIYHNKWKEGYKHTIDALFKKINPDRVVYISMGTLRFMPFIRDIIRSQSKTLSYGEFIKGIDGKYRYFRPLRTRVYREIKEFLLNYVDEDKIYLCMESNDVWFDVFGIKEMSTRKLVQRLDTACRRHFDLI